MTAALSPILAAVLGLCAVDANCAGPLPQAPPTTAMPAAPQQPPASPQSTDTPPEAGDEDALVRSRRFSRWNEFDGKWASIRFGAGYLVDYGAYDQDTAGEQQMPDLETGFKMRDFRMLFKGRLKFPGRKVTWSAGFMYDKANDDWLVRQTGISFETPGITGSIFVGRQKEGFSMSKIMVGYHGWGMERMPMNDSSVQLLADGVKWTGYASRQRVTWNVGAFGDWLSEEQSFSIADHQFIGRVAWQPILSDDGGNLLHLGVALRYAKSDDGQLQPRSRPEAYKSPYFVDSGKFQAESTTMTGLEIYYRPGPLTVGSELIFQKVDAPDNGNPYFHGGEVFVAWNVAGETRSYNKVGGYFNAVSPARSVFDGGPGAWEIVTRFSYIDLDSGPIRGGRFWRFTPLLNWHLDDMVRLEIAYGYGTLDRFSLVGHTHFFQMRLQTSF
jgi:phosphate-selective porin OprO and OprP